jgi:putative ABC transport system permease protein
VATAALQTLLLVIALALIVGLLVVLVVLLFAFLKMSWVTVVQWRDLFSFDRWTEVLVTIGRNKLRTALTTISVAWGIFVLVFLLGLGQGLDNGMRKQFARDATNGVWVWANKTSVAHGGFDVGRRIQFENRDYDRAATVKGIEHISGQHFIGNNRRGSMYTQRGNKANTFGVNAVHPDAIYLAAHDVALGRFLTPADITQRRKSVVIGRPVRDFLFEPDENPIGEWIVVAGVPFQVVGVFTDPSGNEQERQMYIPVSTAQLAYSGSDKLGMLQFTLGDAGPAEAQAIIDEVVGDLATRHNFDPTDKQAVRVHNNIEGYAKFQNLFYMIAAFVTIIGLGTLAAGVVGVSNIMMIAVKERTKEIGVRKALGATPNSIIFMILQEAVFLTGIAGLLGLSAGVGVLELVGKLDNDFIYNPGIKLGHGIAAAVFLVGAGALAGYFPARSAAKVNPIHALRDQ